MRTSCTTSLAQDLSAVKVGLWLLACVPMTTSELSAATIAQSATTFNPGLPVLSQTYWKRA